MAAILFFILAFIFLLLLIKHYFQARQRLPPGPNQFWALAYIPQLIYNPHIALQALSKIYGPVISLQLGRQLLVVASSPETAKAFCRTHDRAFSGRHLPAAYRNLPGSLDSSILLSDCGPAWKLLRSLAQSALFSPRAMEAGAVVRRERVRDLVENLKSREGAAVNLEDMMFATLANIISSGLVSADLFDLRRQADSDYEKVMALVHELIEKMITFGFVDYFPALKWIDFWSKSRAEELYTEIKDIWGAIIAERRSGSRRSGGGDSGGDFLDIVFSDTAFSDDQIANSLVEMLIAATDSTTTTTVWLMVELIRNPDKLTRVRAELAVAADGDGGLSESGVSACSYFQACIKETLRLHVPAPLLVPHRALESRELEGYVIPKDSMVVVNSWAIARDPDIWEDATSFRPERFLGSGFGVGVGYRGTHWEYMPFGSGLRMCPGMSVAVKNVEMVVGSLLHHFEWGMPGGSDPAGMDIREKYYTTLKKETPLLLVPTLRYHNINLIN
ncbi:probable (S)-N-methylcoclaurine 3'-hydroxylase isozyme 2 [Andrographis paniculata]|uniref:probable (S)-N-methylcoclaurine 3'-hydroxylase isozyme 2 n=1 Tax=Andrographis paniculata TaxID=175694 RepID=UPI0021E9AE99|nr:probable (S)-N-methylcoclaurine 3'-hydroxylase isozyme 2 [Andrographis paniculata]